MESHNKLDGGEEKVASLPGSPHVEISITAYGEIIQRQRAGLSDEALIVISMGTVPDLVKSLIRASKAARRRWETSQSGLLKTLANGCRVRQKIGVF